MKKRPLLILIAGIFITCTSTPPMSETNKTFMEETNLSLAIPMRFYTWVKVDNSSKIMPDIIIWIITF